jgi:xanthine dehydrogenase accessory factor
MSSVVDRATGARADVFASADAWLRRDGKVALATVIDTWGSSPVPVGGQMAIAADMSFEGSVSGGCIEGEVITEATEILDHGRPRVMEFGVADETAWGAGLPCGGRVKVFVERVAVDAPGAEQVALALAARSRREGLVIRKRLSDARSELFARDTPGLPADLAERFRTARSGLVAGPDGDVFIQAVVPPARIVAIGATHISQVLCRLAATAGYDIEVVDPRTAFASEARFPGVKLHAEWPQDVLPRIGLDPYTVLCVLAHVEHIDDEALKIAVKSDCRFISALGSSRNHAKRIARLKAAGITDAEIARIKSPIGLDIGAQTPAEIALSVMAEVVLAVRGGKGKAA